MNERIDIIRSLRPLLKLDYDPTKASIDETFQNEVLRPILKFQNSLIMNSFMEYCLKVKVNPLTSKSNPREEIKQIISKQASLRFQMLGMVSGLMTLEEHKYYSHHQKQLNKRITSMLVERIYSQLNLR